MTQKSMNFNDAAIVTVERNCFRILYWCKMKGEAAKRMKNSDLSEKSKQL